MNLGKILQQCKTINEVIGNSDLEICDIEIDSRLVKKNSIFFALPGKSKNGSEFILTAIKNGAAVIVSDDFSICDEFDLKKIVKIKSSDPFELLVEFLKIFYSPLPANIYAVTGTNGKTTVAEFGRQILQFLGKKSTSIGTLGVISNVDQSVLQKSILTTPDIVSFYKNLAVLKQNAVDDVFIEASSIGLEQKRIAGLEILVGAFTNFTQDHLDYHKSMAEYFECKMLLFKNVLKDGSNVVLNTDIPEFAEILKICQQKNHKIFTYGFENSDFKICEIKTKDLQQEIIFEFRNKKHVIKFDIAGEFQAYNILCVLAAVMSKHEMSNEKLEILLKQISQIESVSGRMQKVTTLENKAQIFIDFAHTADALDKVLHLARKLTDSRVLVLFGCGGNRDAKKRPIMGKIACKLADLIIITDDNPRLEDASMIRKEVLSGCDLKKTIEIANRKEAIKQAIAMLQTEDILILAGKGHEKYQVIGDEKFEFDEEEIVKNAIQ